MTKHHIEVITSIRRRRRWSREEKERLVAVCLEPGVSVSDIARRAGIHAVQLFRWRKALCQPLSPSVPRFLPIEVVAPSPAPGPVKATPTHAARKKASVVTIELGCGRRIVVESDVDTEALARILDVIERR